MKKEGVLGVGEAAVHCTERVGGVIIITTRAEWWSQEEEGPSQLEKMQL